jgi:hypothetical protein
LPTLRVLPSGDPISAGPVANVNAPWQKGVAPAASTLADDDPADDDVHTLPTDESRKRIVPPAPPNLCIPSDIEYLVHPVLTALAVAQHATQQEPAALIPSSTTTAAAQMVPAAEAVSVASLLAGPVVAPQTPESSAIGTAVEFSAQCPSPAAIRDNRAPVLYAAILP